MCFGRFPKIIIKIKIYKLREKNNFNERNVQKDLALTRQKIAKH